MVRTTTILTALALALLAVPAALAENVTSPSGDLSIAVPAPVLTGVATTYTITVTNNDPSGQPFSTVFVGGTLPVGLTLKAFGTECARSNKAIVPNTAFTCTWTNVPSGASVSTTLTLVASTPGTYSLPLSLSAALPLPGVPGAFFVVGDSATLNWTVSPGPTDIQVTGSSNQGSPPIGSVFTYAWQVKNNGPQAAYGVTFDDTLPAAIRLGSNLSVDNGTCTADFVAGTVHCDIGTLAVGAQSNITFTAQPTAAGLFANTAGVAMIGPDTKPASNTFTVVVQPK
jgi:uncharacterized repeat protein (TIGR01451 family)